jgi:anti-sigma28 factor (negative regulator of flagellin synthesis)
MLISKISQTMQGELRKIDGSARAKETEKAQPKAKAGDRSEFSASAKSKIETHGDTDIISSMLRAQPDIRADKVAEVQAKVSSGFYNTEAFADQLAGKLATTMA